MAVEDKTIHLAKKYLAHVNKKQAYTLRDAYEDLIATRFQDWAEQEHGHRDTEIEPHEPEERAYQERESSDL